MRDLDRFTSPVERRIATDLVDALLAEGFALRVSDGVGYCHDEPTTDRDSVLDALCSTESDLILVYDDDSVGYRWVLLIWGNGEDLISDYHTGLDAVMGRLA